MAHELDNSTGEYAIAYAGETPWHKHGQKAESGWTLDQWIDAAHVGYEVVRVPALAQLPNGESKDTGVFFNVRSDTNALLGWQTHTDRRVEVQPREIMHFVHDVVSTDDRFQMAVMGAIKGGSQVWATAVFNGAFEVAGEAHQAYLLARTGFDGSLATHFQFTVVRGVCNNTLSAAFCDKRAFITLRHSTKFDPVRIGKQLATMAQSVDTFKQVGDALASNVMAREETAKFFKAVLDIPFDAKAEDISTRKMNQYRQLSSAYSTSVAEGAPRDSAWCALQAVTRYVDHTRSVHGDGDESRFTSAQFGSGSNMKETAMGLLMPRIKDRVLIDA